MFIYCPQPLNFNFSGILKFKACLFSIVISTIKRLKNTKKKEKWGASRGPNETTDKVLL